MYPATLASCSAHGSSKIIYLASASSCRSVPTAAVSAAAAAKRLVPLLLTSQRSDATALWCCVSDTLRFVFRFHTRHRRLKRIHSASLSRLPNPLQMTRGVCNYVCGIVKYLKQEREHEKKAHSQLTLTQKTNKDNPEERGLSPKNQHKAHSKHRSTQQAPQHSQHRTAYTSKRHTTPFLSSMRQKQRIYRRVFVLQSFKPPLNGQHVCPPVNGITS